MKHEFCVAGLRFHEFWNKPEPSLIGAAVELVPEPTNPYDVNAIKVTLEGKHMGYVPRTETEAIRRLSDFGKPITAIVINHFDKAIFIRASND